MNPELIILANKNICEEFDDPHAVRSMADIETAARIPDRMKAAIHIAKTHPFMEANKRTAIIVLYHDRPDDDIERTIYSQYDTLKLLSNV
jgi:hypothetical protein